MANIRKLEQQLKVVANARRLAILAFLKQKRSATSGEIAQAVRLNLAPASQHFRILKAAGIIEYKRRGQHITYRLSLKQEEPVKTILSML